MATGWMPGRIALVRARGLTTDGLRHLVGQETGEAPFAAVVVLVDERDDLSRFGPIVAAVPVVIAGRPADRIWLERAVHVDLSVHPVGQEALSPQVRQRRESHEALTFGEPGTVRGCSCWVDEPRIVLAAQARDDDGGDHSRPAVRLSD